jgi:hypothetical protein
MPPTPCILCGACDAVNLRMQKTHYLLADCLNDQQFKQAFNRKQNRPTEASVGLFFYQQIYLPIAAVACLKY